MIVAIYKHYVARWHHGMNIMLTYHSLTFRTSIEGVYRGGQRTQEGIQRYWSEKCLGWVNQSHQTLWFPSPFQEKDLFRVLGPTYPLLFHSFLGASSSPSTPPPFLFPAMTFGLLWEKSRSSSYRSQVGKSPGRKPRGQTPHAAGLRAASSMSVYPAWERVGGHASVLMWRSQGFNNGATGDKVAFQSTDRLPSPSQQQLKNVTFIHVLQILRSAGESATLHIYDPR